MTAGEAISRADAARPNAIAELAKMQWLRQLDMELRREVLSKSEVGEAFANTGLDINAMNQNSVLLAPSDLGAMYVHWLCAQVDLTLGELDRYAADAALYNSVRSAFAASVRRNYPPKAQVRAVW